jgi:hypothetical protein
MLGLDVGQPKVIHKRASRKWMVISSKSTSGLKSFSEYRSMDPTVAPVLSDSFSPGPATSP